MAARNEVVVPPPEAPAQGKSCSKTVTDTVTGEHEHTIVGYSLVKGIGDGEPIASERFTVGGHEWVLLFYPDGKRSSSTEGHLPQGAAPGAIPGPAPAFVAAPPPDGNAQPLAAGEAPPAAIPAHPGNPANAANPAAAADGRGQAPRQLPQAGPQNPPVMGYPRPQPQHPQPIMQHPRREQTNDYAALFVALIGESDAPQGVVNTSDGRVVRAFHRFTLVDQTGAGRDLTKGRRRDQGAVKISCARQDPNARNCHGYRKFVKRTVLENPQSGFLKDDTIIIRYTIELVVSSGGALSRAVGQIPPKVNDIQVPPAALGKDMATLLEEGNNADVTFRVESEEMAAHKILLTTRSPVFNALLNGEMREGKEGVVTIEDVRAPVFRALLHFVYTDTLPEELEGPALEVAMAQHLLVAADRFQLARLRRICERRLCETVEVETVATTLALAEQNHAEELKRVCLEFVSKNLSPVMASDGYQHMVTSCPQLQAELLQVIAVTSNERSHRSRVHAREQAADGAPDEGRRVRQRRE